jgi:uncharacterized 2Fe-2S/4Fe-4S cluster protein (DUF4445 family)
LKISSNATIYLPENIAGYVGGDHVAMMVATNSVDAHDIVLALDIGTNTEISLVKNGNIYSCSCASGPAFEGAHIKMGCGLLMAQSNESILKVIVFFFLPSGVRKPSNLRIWNIGSNRRDEKEWDY